MTREGRAFTLPSLLFGADLMPTATSWPIPYIPQIGTLAIDALASFLVSILLAVLVNAEAQAFAATFLGDARPGVKDRFHFNAFLHLDVMGTVCYLVGGFGWPKAIDVNPEKFKYPRLFTFLTRLAGPLANLLLANIAASLMAAMRFLGMDPLVFMMVLGVNVTTAVYNLIPIPPLALSELIIIPFSRRLEKLAWLFRQAGPFIIVAIFLLERITEQGIISPYLNPLVRAAVKFITG